jgi:hypothetical protein
MGFFLFAWFFFTVCGLLLWWVCKICWMTVEAAGVIERDHRPIRPQTKKAPRLSPEPVDRMISRVRSKSELVLVEEEGRKIYKWNNGAK